MKKSFICKILSILFSFCALFFVLTACNMDTNNSETPNEHVCEYKYGKFTEKYLASPATCTTSKKYYYCCSCGKKGDETFDYGEPLKHVYTNFVSDNNASYEQDGTLTAQCELGCGTTKTIPDPGSKLFKADLSFTINKSKNNNFYSLTITGLSENTVMEKEDFDNVLDNITFQDGITWQKTEYDAKFVYIDTVIVNNVETIKNFTIMKYLYNFSIYFSDDVKNISNNAFNYDTTDNPYIFGTKDKIRVYFEGDCPSFESEEAYTFGYNALSAVFYYNEGAKGFDEEYNFNKSITFKKLGEEVNTDYTIEFLANGAHEKSIEMATEIFTGYIKENKVLPALYPMATLDTYVKIKDFTLELTKNCKTETEKAKTIFNWVTSNITYDMDAIFYTCDEVFAKRRGVCAGYTFIMHDMLSSVGIMSLFVSGIAGISEPEYSANDVFNYVPESIQTTKKHGWNIAYIDGQAVIIDATWGLYDIKTPYYYGGYRVATDVEAFSVIPDGVSYKAFPTTIYEIDGNVYYFDNYGELLFVNMAGKTYNYAYNINVRFKAPRDGITIKEGVETPMSAMYKNAILYYGGSEIPLYYNLSDGRSFSYIDILKYVFLENSVYNIDYVLPESDMFTLYDGIAYLLKDGKYSAYAVISKKETVVIPSKINGIEVLSIGVDCFENDSVIKKLVIPSSIKSIESGAFYGCKNLKEIEFSEGLEAIYMSAFANTGVEIVELPNSLKILDMQAFYECENLKYIKLGNNIKDFNANILEMSPSVEEVDFESEGKNFKSVNGVIYNNDMTELIYYPTGKTLTEFTVPSTVTTIKSGAFKNAKNLKKISLPNGLKVIERTAFTKCVNLVEINIPSTVENIDVEVFIECASLKKITIDCKVKTLNDVFAWCTSLEEVVIGEGVEELINGVFIRCENLKKITLPKSLKMIGRLTFDGNTSLNTVIYNGTIEEWNKIYIDPDYNDAILNIKQLITKN